MVGFISFISSPLGTAILCFIVSSTALLFNRYHEGTKGLTVFVIGFIAIMLFCYGNYRNSKIANEYMDDQSKNVKLLDDKTAMVVRKIDSLNNYIDNTLKVKIDGAVIALDKLDIIIAIMKSFSNSIITIKKDGRQANISISDIKKSILEQNNWKITIPNNGFDTRGTCELGGVDKVSDP